MTHLTTKKNGILKKNQMSSICYGPRFSQPKYHNPRWKIVTGKNEHFGEKKMRFFLMSQGSFNPKIRFLCQKVCPVARPQTQTHTHIDTHESDCWGHPFRVSGQSTWNAQNHSTITPNFPSGPAGASCGKNNVWSMHPKTIWLPMSLDRRAQ